MKTLLKCNALKGYIIPIILMLMIAIICICIGSVNYSPMVTLRVIMDAVLRRPVSDSSAYSIIVSVRIPRVICAALVGASLSLCGAAMQGLLRNPLADGSTLGVSSGASLGAVIAITFGFTLPGLPFAGTAVLSVIFAFLSLTVILSLAYKMDHSLSTGTIILIGVIFTMFASSIMSICITFAESKLKTIVFWTMGSLANAKYANVLTLLVTLVVCSVVILHYSPELNAFAIGEENARNIGINVKKVKLVILIVVSILIGVCVSIGGTIGFVGLVIPHMVRMLFGPNHKKLLPMSLIGGASFLMLTDLAGRTILSPKELPIGVVTSFIGSIVFTYIFYISRKGRS